MTTSKRTNKSTGATTVTNAFNDLLREYQMEDKYKEKQLIASWGRMMGKPIAIRTEKLYFRDKKLFVHLNSAPLKSELDHSKGKVIEILKREFGDDILDEVVFL